MKQQPSSGCEGISNLINSSSTVEICGTEDSTSSEFCDVLTCSTSDWSLVLSFHGCYREFMLNVTDDRDNVSIYKVFPSKEQLQELNHTLGNQTGIISLTSRVVASDHKMYYLVTLDSPLFNISFPMTAIPVECTISGKHKQLAHIVRGFPKHSFSISIIFNFKFSQKWYFLFQFQMHKSIMLGFPPFPSDFTKK